MHASAPANAHDERRQGSRPAVRAMLPLPCVVNFAGSFYSADELATGMVYTMVTLGRAARNVVLAASKSFLRDFFASGFLMRTLSSYYSRKAVGVPFQKCISLGKPL